MSNITLLVTTLSEQLLQHSLMISTAESCTGGGLSECLTSLTGSSSWFDRGFITYSNHAKTELLDVSKTILEEDGAVSEACVKAMAEGAIRHSQAHISVAISGVAGPSGGSTDKPVGTVWLAFAGARQPTKAVRFNFSGDREAVRQQAIVEALKGLIARAKAYSEPTSTPKYFIALWPDAKTRAILNQKACQFTEHHACRQSEAQNLHLTMHYLHGLTPSEAELVLPDELPIAPFELSIHKASYWSHNQVAHFSVEKTKPLMDLHVALAKHLTKLGLKPETRTFLPHITFAKHFPKAFEPTEVGQIHWFVHELCLVASQPEHGKSNYEIIKRTPLPLKTC